VSPSGQTAAGNSRWIAIWAMVKTEAIGVLLQPLIALVRRNGD
jgi:hypothetical protein